MATPIQEPWHRFCIDVVLARSYPYLFMQFGANTAPRNVVLERLLPSLLLIKLTAILDAGLTDAVATLGLRPAREDLCNRIRALDAGGHLLDADALTRLRLSRNLLAHESDTGSDWTEFNAEFATVEAALQHLGLIDRDQPKYAYFSKRDDADSGGSPGTVYSRKITFGVLMNGEPCYERIMTQKFYGLASKPS